MVTTDNSALAVLFLGRALYGLGSGLTLHAAPSYISECSPPKLRGTLTAFIQLFITIGIIYGQGESGGEQGEREKRKIEFGEREREEVRLLPIAPISPHPVPSLLPVFFSRIFSCVYLFFIETSWRPLSVLISPI